MKNVKIFEQNTYDKDKCIGKIAILTADPTVKSPKKLMDAAVKAYVGSEAYNEFIEIFLDNPWVRVIVKDINKLKFVAFDKHRL